mgnify:FL=1
MSPLTRLYLAFSQVSDPIWRLVHRKRLKKGKEVAARLPEKYGVAPHDRPAGRVLWFHALSVGESLALVPIIERALSENPDAYVVLTTSTATSIAALDKAGLPECATHVLLPIDTTQSVRRFLDHWRPTVAVFAELDFWPRLMIETHRRGIPMILVNSRLSRESYESRRRLGGMMRDILGLFDQILLQNADSVARFKDLGARDNTIHVVGALKAAARPLPADLEEVEDLRQRIGERPVWLAAATCDVEEPLMIATHQRVVACVPNVLLIIAPRFLQSADALQKTAMDAFANVARRSDHEVPDAQTQVYIADTIGEMGLWYRLAPVSFVGHSLGPPGKPLGGKNPYEAAALGSVVIHGKAVADFSETYDTLKTAGAAVEVLNEQDLSKTVLRLFETSESEPIRMAAQQVILSQQRVLEDTWAAIARCLETAH